MFDTIKKRLIAAGMSTILVVTATHMILPYEGQVVNEKGQHVAYVDIVGVPTTCWGLTGKDMNGNQIRKGNKYTQQECEASLVKELTEYNRAMKKHVKVPLSPGEEAAYTSFVWNLGETNFRNSTLLKKLNANDRSGACAELLRWNRAGGVEVKGLTNRRKDEYMVCMGNKADFNKAYEALKNDKNPLFNSDVGEGISKRK